MASYSDLICSKGGVGNTGFDPNCFLDILQMSGGAIASTDLVIPEADLTPSGIIPYLQTLTYDDDPDARIYPLPEIELTAKTGGDLRTSTSTYGKPRVNGENPYLWTLGHYAGADLQTKLRLFNSNGGRGIILWDGKCIYMLNNGDGTASPFPLNLFWALPIDPTNGNDPTVYSIQIGMETGWFNDQRYAQQYSGSIAGLKGLQDIHLDLLSWTESSGAFSVQLIVGNKNLYSRYKTTLSGTGKSFWQAVNDLTGGAVTVSSVAANDGAESFDGVLSTSDTDFPAGSQGIDLSLVGPTALFNGNIKGYESDSVLLPTTP